ncbi:30S ribosomal protein S6--L-glutamate ligase [uncultured Algimonas sp.]|uniref:30S ribosomal protein S6--L-glutamate ligase n=1 Tax=uncultured Algimonas sp. TaxID=1547920 RepID=UPI00260F77B2|nr:30S ribosomal protein S6--L-glutamate ligase [uncultured Algimonas sp.]
MKIALFTRNGNLYSHKRLREAAEARGHEINAIDHMKCLVDVSSDGARLLYKGTPLLDYDALIPRIGASVTYYGTTIVRQMEVMGVFALNPSLGITQSRDKLRSLQLMSERGIGMPRTIFTHRDDYPGEEIGLLGGAPVVLKVTEGTHGVGVMLLKDDSSAKAVMQAFAGTESDIILQEFIEEAGGEDVRCLVVGDEVVAAMLRKGKEGDFRSNLHQGGSATVTEISDMERSTALACARAMGLEMCGVDLLRSDRGPVVMEVNSSPGLKGIETATGIDVADKVIAHIETRLSGRS